MFSLYRGLTILGGPLIRVYLAVRRRLGKEDRVRFAERLGVPGLDRPPGALVWVHAASVGEALSVLPLVGRIGQRGGRVLLTTGTVTSARMVAGRLPAGAIHQYMPVDRPGYVRRFLDHWHPDLILWTESDFWPNMLDAVARQRLPLVLVQGRISPRSFARWRRLPGAIARLLGGFDLCLAQTEADADRLRALGAPMVRCLGNLKYSVPPLPADPAELAGLSARLAGRPCWLAASTHPGEEEIAIAVHRAVSARYPDLLTLIVPRQTGRGAEIAALGRAAGLEVARRSAGDHPGPGHAVYLADTMGELGLFYRLAPIVFMGKSLEVGGGQNPFEPARLGCAVLFGPRMDNFPDMPGAMIRAGAARQVADGGDLAAAVLDLLTAPGRLEAMRRAAAAWAAAEASVLDAVEAALDPALSRLGGGDAGP